MNRPVLSPNFTVEDIHKLREYNYYQTKDMSQQERIDYYNTRGMEVQKEIQARKLQKL
ncbi:hypothetical protein IMSAG025_00978 [Muribaculaceae bacterium]|jgi:hypothetical protein|nr:hypothetical protein IMSAGC002_02214 [Lachnospiraceae bacterium]GFI57538.1 hypothetical protein IMSAG025_00978 [Muribaculaceae bacterium]